MNEDELTKEVAPAFLNYLTSLPRVQAVQYVYDCLRNGESGNEAWALMELTHGENWSCPPAEMGAYINQAINHQSESL